MVSEVGLGLGFWGSKLHQIKRKVERLIPGAGKKQPPISGQFRVRPASWCMREKPRKRFAQRITAVCVRLDGGGHSHACWFSVRRKKPQRSSVCQFYARNQKVEEVKATTEEITRQQAILRFPAGFRAFLRAPF